MREYEYKVVPFMGVVKSGQTATHVANQLQGVIGENTNDGWEFYQLGEVNIEVKPGCIASLFGRESDYIKYDQLIFRKSAT